MAEPFFDSLSGEKKALVLRNRKGENRPSYYSSTIASGATRANSDALSQQDQDPDVQISLDLEAVFILLPTATKRTLVQFLRNLLSLTSSSPDEILLMLEIQQRRKDGLVQVVNDVGLPLRDYDFVRNQVVTFIGTNDGVQESVIPDLSALFRVASTSRDQTTSSDTLEIHNRIADTGVVNAYLTSATYRDREIRSWIDVVQVYMSVT